MALHLPVTFDEACEHMADAWAEGNVGAAQGYARIASNRYHEVSDEKLTSAGYMQNGEVTWTTEPVEEDTPPGSRWLDDDYPFWPR